MCFTILKFAVPLFIYYSLILIYVANELIFGIETNFFIC